MANLAYTWKSQGRLGEAIALLKEAKILREEVLGREHPDTKNTTRGYPMNRHSQNVNLLNCSTTTNLNLPKFKFEITKILNYINKFKWSQLNY